jgi:uncharacterized membrane protein YdjX (TVP38/TMEM64 family)
LVLFVGGTVAGLGDNLGDLRTWLGRLGLWGPFAFMRVYALGVIIAVPASLLTIMGGLLFGWAHAILYVAVGATVGAAVSFLIARYVARDAVAHHLERSERFEQPDKLTATQGPMIVALLRIVPISPFFLMNYGLGLTRVRFSTYVLWSLVGMMPTTIVYAVGADAITRGLLERRVPISTLAVLLAVIMGLIVVAARASKRLSTL